MTILRLGSKGPDVRRVQQALNRRMLPPNNQITKPPMARLVPDGDFGNLTRTMVVEFQRLNGQKPDGEVGPITSFLLFPFLTFKGQLKGNGRIRGRALEIGATNRSVAAVRRGIGGAKAKEPTVGGDAEKEEITFEDSFSAGVKHEFKPWFVLKPQDEPEGAKSSATVALEAVLLRKAGFEFSGGFEFTRQLSSARGTSWEWEGSITGTYADTPDFLSGTLTPFSPAASLKLAQQGKLAFGLGAEASIRFFDDTLELSVGGEAAMQFDPHDGNLLVGGEVSAALKINIDVIRRREKAK